MNMFKTLFVASLIALGLTSPAMAQDKENDDEHFPYSFIGIQGGVQNTFNKEFNNCKTFTPTASISFGHYFTPVVGARLHFNGIWNKSGVDYCTDIADTHYRYNYVTGSGDVLVNLCTLFGKKSYYPVNLIFVGGLGANYAFENDGRAEAEAAKPCANFTYADNDNRWAFNGRLGLALDINLHKNLSLNIEGDYNHIVPGKTARFNTDNHQVTAQVGLNFRFGYKKKVEPEPVAEPEEIWATRIDTTWYDEPVFTDRIENGTKTWNVFFGKADSKFDAAAQLKAIGTFLKDFRDCKISVKSYADVQTGNPTINMKYSKERAESTVKALVDAGVNESQITSEYFGDTVQPFAENDKNRVSIITATGLKDIKDKSSVKKFKTKEVRYRVQ